MKLSEWIDLQRFADGGAGGAGAGGAAAGDTGVSAPDAGEQSLDLHTPRTSRQRERAKRRQARVGQQNGVMASASAAGSASPGTQQQSLESSANPSASEAGEPADNQGIAAQADAQGTGTEGRDTAQGATQGQSEPTHKPSFDELLQDPEHKKAFDKRVNAMFRQRFQDEEGRKERDGNVDQLMITLAQILGQTVEDPAKLDPAALRQALIDNQTVMDAAAMEAGVSSQQYRADLQMRSENATMRAQLQQQKAQQQANAQEQQRRQAFLDLQQEAEQLKSIYPQLDLGQMMQDPQTIRTMQALQMAGAKDPVRTVYEATNREQIMGGLAARAAQTGMQKVANSVAANSRRPNENGQRGQGGIMTSMDPRNLSKAQRKEIRERVRRGEIVTF